MPEFSRVARVSFTIGYTAQDELTPEELRDALSDLAEGLCSRARGNPMGDRAEFLEWEPGEEFTA